MFHEIGSEFWLDRAGDGSTNHLPPWLTKYGDVVLTNSGRGSLSLLLKQINPKFKTALLPAYICDSVISPFLNHGYRCYFYEVGESLSPSPESIETFQNIGVFLHMGYFGFCTNGNITPMLEKFKEQSTIIVEDVTHSLFSNFCSFEFNDFYIGSIRKWFGLPSGGFLASSKRVIQHPLARNESFSKLRTKALLNKAKFIQTGDLGVKNLFQNQFAEAEHLLNQDVTPCKIDSLSWEMVRRFNSDSMREKRRTNFNILAEELIELSYVDPLFGELFDAVCPLFFPVLIKTDRDAVQKKLIDEKIYCPVHWPIPYEVKRKSFGTACRIYDTILSIPCDQRYSSSDMERIVSCLRVHGC